MYPEIEPYNQGMLDVGDGNAIYWESCGNPNGKPVVILHGGPGSGCTPKMRRYFDPAAYRIILFDQRHCGRSIPHASDLNVDLMTNTTQHLIEDIEALRGYINIDRWMLFGGSWGTTLGLAYAEQYPNQVTEIVFFGITMTRKSEIDWLYRHVAPMFPEQWARFRAGITEREREGDLVQAYYHLLNHQERAIREKAAQDWHDWEAASLSLDPHARPSPRWSNPEYRITRARIITHYFYHRAFLEEGILLREVHRLFGIPGILIQGRLDLQAPLRTAWELYNAWPDSELRMIYEAGHSLAEEAMINALIVATDQLRE